LQGHQDDKRHWSGIQFKPALRQLPSKVATDNGNYSKLIYFEFHFQRHKNSNLSKIKEPELVQIIAAAYAKIGSLVSMNSWLYTLAGLAFAAWWGLKFVIRRYSFCLHLS